jgi:hypothetical protein
LRLLDRFPWVIPSSWGTEVSMSLGPPVREALWASRSLPLLRECSWVELAVWSPARSVGVLASWAESLMLGKCGGRHGVRCVCVSPSLARVYVCWSESFAKTRLILWWRVGCGVRVRRGMRAPPSRVVFRSVLRWVFCQDQAYIVPGQGSGFGDFPCEVGICMQLFEQCWG